jgi:tape measure domain-containing protein
MANNTVIHSVEFTGDASKLQAACLQASQAVAGLGNTASSNATKVQSLSSSLDKLGSKLSSFGSSLTVGLTAPLVLLGKQLFTNAASFEQIAVSFEVFTGSAEVAKNMLGQLKDMALKSPMQFQDITKGAQTLLGYGLTAQQVIPITQRLGDISGGNSDKFSRLALAFGQVNAAGRLMGQETRQMINAGFNPLQAISDKTGESMASLTKRMHDGQISVQEVADAMKYATSEGGRFYGMLDKQSQTLQGQFNKLSESITFAFAEIGQSLANASGVQNFFVYLSATIETLKNKFLALSPEAQTTIVKIGAFLALLGPATFIIGGVITAMLNLSKAIAAVRVAMVALMSSNAIGWILLALPAIALALGFAIDKFNDFGNAIDETIAKANNALNSFKIESVAESINKLKGQISELQKNPINPTLGIYTQDQATKRITLLRKELEGLEKIYAKLNNVNFDNKPPGKDGPAPKVEEEIPFQIGKVDESNRNFILKKDKEKYKDLLDNAVLGYSAIQDVEKNYRDKSLADLYINQQDELKIYDKFGIDTTALKETHLKQRAFLEELYAKRGKDLLINSMNNAIEINKKGAESFEPSLDTTKIQFGFDEARIRSQADNLKRFGAEVYAAQVQVATQLAVGFSQIVGSVISGDLSIGDAFASLGAMFLDAIGGFLVQVGEAAIKAGIVKLIIENAFKGLGGGALIGIGMAAVAIGTAMQNVGKKTSQAIQAKGASNVSTSGMSSATSSAIKSGTTYQSGSQTYGGQVVRLSIDLTGSITSTQTGYQINKSLETVLRVTGR